MKPMHAVGQPPIGGAGRDYFMHFHYLTEIGTPYSRLHNVGGAYGRNQFVDIPNIFRDFDADENDPASYDFAFTDALTEAGIEPYYRLGVTIENQAEIKSYRIDPPKDYAKWARICEHIIAHYIDGWADGFRYRITYWEIWNEPDDGLRVSQMWNGTAEDYYRLYETAAKHLKSVFGDRIKVGGYAALFDPYTCRPFHAYYSLAAFDQLYRLGSQTEAVCGAEGVYAVSAAGGEGHAPMISNISGRTQELVIEGADLSRARWHTIDQPRLLSWCPPAKVIENNQVLLIEW